MSFEHPNRNNESMSDVELRHHEPPAGTHNTTNLDLAPHEPDPRHPGPPGAVVPRHPHHRHQRQGLHRTHGRGHLPRLRHAHRPVHLAPSGDTINERIAIDGQQLSDDDFVDIMGPGQGPRRPRGHAKMDEQGKPKMSFFEVLTAMAIWKFADAPVDVAIVEVGMGGLMGRHQRARRGRGHHRPGRHGPHGSGSATPSRTDRHREGRHHQAELHRHHRPASRTRTSRHADSRRGRRQREPRHASCATAYEIGPSSDP